MRARVNDLVLVQGIRDTRTTLAGWNRDPGPVLRAWLLGSLAISVLLLLAVWMIAAISHPDPTPILLPGLNEKATLGSAAQSCCATRSCWRCTRSPAWPGSSPAPRCP